MGYDARAHGATPERWLYVRLSLLMFLQLAVTGAWFPLLPLHLKKLQLTDAAIAWCCSTSALAAVLAPVFWGQVADRWLAGQACIAFCSFMAAMMLALLAECTAAWEIFLATFGFWFFMMPVFTLATALTFRHLTRPERQYGPIRMWGTIGWVAAGLLLTAWRAQPDFLASIQTVYPPDDRSDFLLLAAGLGFVLSLYALTLPATPPSPSRFLPIDGLENGPSATPPIRPRRFWAALEAPLLALHLFRKRSFRILCFCMFGSYLTLPFYLQMTPLLLRQGVSEEWLPATLTIAQSLEVVTLGLLPLIVLRLEERGTLLLGLLAWAALLIVLTIGEPLELAIPALGLQGVFICCFVVTGQVFVNRRAAGDIRASAQALLTCTNGMGLFVGHHLAGWIRGHSEGRLAPAFTIAAIIATALVGVFLFGFRDPAERKANPTAFPESA